MIGYDKSVPGTWRRTGQKPCWPYLGCYADLFDRDYLFQVVRLFRLFSYFGDILVRGSFLDFYGLLCRFDVFDVGSTAPDPVQFLRSGDKNEVLVDDVDYDALASGFSAVEFDADASDFNGWHSLTSRV